MPIGDKTAQKGGQMEIFTFNILPMAEIERRQAFKEAVNNCPICASALQFSHEIDFLSNQVAEACTCPQCNLKIRAETYNLQ